MSTPVWMENLEEAATGTEVSGKQCLDVFVADGNITFTEEATAADGGALPALVKVVGGYDGANVQVIKTDVAGNLLTKITDGTLDAGLSALIAAQHTLTVPTNAQVAASISMGWDGTNHREILVDAAGKLSLSFADVTATGNITSTESVTLTATGLSSAAVLITGTWTGTVTLEGSVDGVTFYATTGAVFSGGLVSSNFSSNNSFQMNCSAFSAVRIRGNTVSSGTAVVTIRANSTAGPVVLTEALPQGGNVIGLVGQSGTWTVTANEAGFVKANTPARNVYSSVNVTTAAYVQLVASTTTATKEIEIFDSSGQTMMLATGAAAAEVDQMLIFPGGNGRVKLAIAAATRVSIKAVSATASVGEIGINFYG